MFDDYKVKPLHKILSKTGASVKGFDEQTTRMCYLIEDDDLLEKYNTIWDKASVDIKKKSDNEPIMKGVWETAFLNLFIINQYCTSKMFYFKTCVIKSSGRLLFSLFLISETSNVLLRKMCDQSKPLFCSFICLYVFK